MILPIFPVRDARCRKDDRTVAISKAEEIPCPDTSPMATPIFCLSLSSIDYKIIIITTGFITVDTFAGYIESINFQIIFWKKILLNFLGQIKRLLHSFTLDQPICHFVDYITGVADFIIAGYPNFFIKLAVSYPAQGLYDFTKGQGKISADQHGNETAENQKNDHIDED